MRRVHTARRRGTFSSRRPTEWVMPLLTGSLTCRYVMMPIRSEIISSSVRHASALEAAIWSRRVELVKLLIVRARISADERNRLACLARDLSASDIAEFLDPGVDATCVSGLVMQSIQARGGESGVSP